jgi:protein-S-isoprenylcysteine O-methyltransferase Ste14
LLARAETVTMTARAMNPDLLIYAAHALFWGAFGMTRVLVRQPPAQAPASAGSAATGIAPYSRALLAFHSVAFVVMYFGIGSDVLSPHPGPRMFAGQPVIGALVIAAGAAVACWALVYFASWRLRAKIDAGHQLATGGPFAYLRHPIYLALDLLALGSAIWIPTPALWLSVALMCIGGDLRARAEERLLLRVFGAAYDTYRERTRRFVPRIY